MQRVKFEVITRADWEAPASRVVSLLEDLRIVGFSGDLGAGKTTLVQHICQQLGVDDHVTSPSFSIVNEYLCRKGKIFHFDLYRISTPQELADIGWDEYLESGHICLIEWPEMARGLLDGYQGLQVHIRMEKDRREITFQNTKAW